MAKRIRIIGTDELQDGEITEVKVDGHVLAVSRSHGDFHVIGGACPHHGASLGDGVLDEGHVRCPWHQALFHAETGALEGPPSLDGVPAFPVRVEGEDVYVELPEEAPEAVAPAMATQDTDADGRHLVVLGAGAGGLTAAEELRAAGYRGRLTLLAAEPDEPYDRPDLSKRYLRQAEARKPFLRDREFYARHDIELRLGTPVQSVDVPARRLELDGGEALEPDGLILALGATPRTLDVPGADFDGVLTLRSYADCEKIKGLLQTAETAVVVGASFIGMEVAAGLNAHGLSVTVVAPEEVPFAATLGPAIGEMYRDVQLEHGTAFRLGRSVERFTGEKRLDGVALDSGEILPADLVVLGVGVEPATGILRGVPLQEDRSVAVDDHLRLADGVYAIGDMATVPDPRTQSPTRVEHWVSAQQHAAVAARNLAGEETALTATPFFWTSEFMVMTRYVGHAPAWDEILYDGDPAAREFVAYYLQDNRVRAVAGCNRDRAMAAIRGVMERDPLPPVEPLRAVTAAVRG
jgi:NADPH-dependent 2,4-dienoyl-CoA reductase/sulfur reductase-like enzyme/nitrite reductase/ring-hydroxylating ferredoxin subunit